jgi:hypothetical protein
MIIPCVCIQGRKNEKSGMYYVRPMRRKKATDRKGDEY